MKSYIKPWEELKFTDDYMFCKIMRDKKICKEFVETILNIKIKKINYIIDQEELRISPESKYVKLDIRLEDIDKITIEEITEYYDWLISNAKIDIFMSGKIDEKEFTNVLLENQNIKDLNPREGYYILNRQSTESRQNVENEVFESMNVVQGKLVLGLNVDFDDENLQAIALVYNAILWS